jgi:fumarate reductase subunit C
MGGFWWRRNPFYRWYILRELSSVFIAAFALELLWGLLALSRGRAVYEAWLGWLATPGVLTLHALAFAFVVYHAWTWFKIMPKTLPRLPLPDALIVVSGVSAVMVVSAILLWMA